MVLRNRTSSSGQTYPLVCSTGIRRFNNDVELHVPCASGFVGDSKVVVMKDTSCSSVTVKRDLVEFTGKEAYVRAFDGTVRKYPMVDVDTPYIVDNVEAVCVPEPVYDLIISNVSGARNPDNPDPEWVQSNAVTRAQAKGCKNLLPLKVLDGSNGDPVDKTRLIELQKEDRRLDKFREKVGVVSDNGKVTYEVKSGCKVGCIGRHMILMVLVLTGLRHRVMEVAHDSIFAGHMGVKRTMEKIMSNFYWPRLHGDVMRFCRACNICQKTIQKGRVVKAPLEKMPLVDAPFSCRFSRPDIAT